MSPLPSLLCMWCVYVCTHACSCVLKVDSKRFSSPAPYRILLDGVSWIWSLLWSQVGLSPLSQSWGSRHTQPYLASTDPGNQNLSSYACPARLYILSHLPSPWPLLFLNSILFQCPEKEHLLSSLERQAHWIQAVPWCLKLLVLIAHMSCKNFGNRKRLPNVRQPTIYSKTNVLWISGVWALLASVACRHHVCSLKPLDTEHVHFAHGHTAWPCSDQTIVFYQWHIPSVLL